MALPPKPPGVVFGAISMEDGQASIPLSWSPSVPLLDGNVTASYTIESRSYAVSNQTGKDLAEWTLWRNLVAPVSSYADVLTVLVRPQTFVYEFRVTARNGLGVTVGTVASNTVIPIMSRPSITAAQVTVGNAASSVSSVLVRWNGDLVASSYKVEYTNSSGNWLSVNTPPDLHGTGSLLIGNLNNQELYRFRVTSITAEGLDGTRSFAARFFILLTFYRSN